MSRVALVVGNLEPYTMLGGSGDLVRRIIMENTMETRLGFRVKGQGLGK